MATVHGIAKESDTAEHTHTHTQVPKVGIMTVKWMNIKGLLCFKKKNLSQPNQFRLILQ